MSKFHVTLKANLSDGELYWVTNVPAESEDAAMQAAETRFMTHLEQAGEWSFSEADIELL